MRKINLNYCHIPEELVDEMDENHIRILGLGSVTNGYLFGKIDNGFSLSDGYSDVTESQMPQFFADVINYHGWIYSLDISFPDGIFFSGNTINIKIEPQKLFNYLPDYASLISHYIVYVRNTKYENLDKAINIPFRKSCNDICLDGIIRPLIPDEKFDRTHHIVVSLDIILVDGQEINDAFEADFYAIDGYLLPGQRLHNVGAVKRAANGDVIKEPYTKVIPVFTHFENLFSIPVFGANGANDRNAFSWSSGSQHFGGKLLMDDDVFPTEPYIETVVVPENQVTEECWCATRKEYEGENITDANARPTISSFTSQFDDPFQEPSERDAICVLIPCDRKDGIFLRWRDNMSMWHSYLFDKGEEELGIEESSENICVTHTVSEMAFQMKQSVKKELSNRIKCGASRINNNIFEDIRSVSFASYIEMYVDGVFVRVKCASSNIKRNMAKELNDIEIELVTFEIDTSI